MGLFFPTHILMVHDVLAFLCQPPRDPDPAGPEGMISVAISSHYFFGEDQRTAQLEEIVRRFPDWTFPSSWVSTYDMYRYWELHTSEADADGRTGPETVRGKNSFNSTEDQPCSLFTWTRTCTNTRSCSLLACLRDPLTVSVGLVAKWAGRCTETWGKLSILMHRPPQASCSLRSYWNEGVTFFCTQSVVPLLQSLHFTPRLLTSSLFLPL